MYNKKDDWLGNRIYTCPKCEKMMGNDSDTIKLHDEKFCIPIEKIIPDDSIKKPKKKRKATRKRP